jgi:hypothetical protein
MVWIPKSPAIIHAPAEALDKYGNLRIGGGLPSPRRMMMAAAGATVNATLTFIAMTDDTTNLTTYTFSGQSFSTAAADRQIVVCTQGPSNGGRAVSSMTIGGISATMMQRVGTSSNYPNEIWTATVPTGASGTISIQWSGSSSRCSIGVFAMYGASTTKNEVGSSIANPPTDDVTCNAGGVMIASVSDGYTGGADASNWAWTGLTERGEIDSESTQLHGVAGDAFSTLQTDLTVTATPTGGPDEPVLNIVSWDKA